MTNAFRDDLSLDRTAERLRGERAALARHRARFDGFPEDQIGAYVDAAEGAFVSVGSAMAADRQRGRRRMRSMRRELRRAALVAAGVPGWIRWAVWLGQWTRYVLPAPFNIIVPAVLWVVERMIQADEESPA